VAAVADPGSRFDAVVVAEYEQEFAGYQLVELPPLLRRFGVQLWLPEANSPVAMDDAAARR
jgi:hypothetical protein